MNTRPPRRVLQVTGSLGLGGAEAMITSIHEALDHSRVQFDFLVFEEDTGGFEADVLSLGGRVIRAAPPRLGAATSFVRSLTRLIKENGPYAAVHSHVNFASAPVLFAAARAGVTRRVAHAHNAGDARQSFPRRAYTLTSRAVLTRTATDLLGCSQLAGRYVFGRRWEADGRVIPNAIDVERFADARPLDRLRNQLGIASDVLLLGSIASLRHEKNHYFLLDLMAHPEMEALAAHLVVVGRGELQPDLERRIEQLDIGDRVHLVGARRDVPHLMNTLDYMLLPSFSEGLPVVLVEAQAARLPSIVSAYVTTEIDLGLDLIDYLPLDFDAWVSRLQTPRRPIPTREQAVDALRAGGYAAESSAAQLLEIYGLAP